MANHYKRLAPLSPARQWDALKRANLDGWTGALRQTGFVGFFFIRPLPASRRYEVRVSFAQDKAPQVHVLSPNLFTLAGDRKPPHIYPPIEHPARLCLYLPTRGEWTPQMPIADTIVPWAAEWLFHFELWLGTDEWHGGGEHPALRPLERFSARLEKRWRQKHLQSARGTP